MAIVISLKCIGIITVKDYFIISYRSLLDIVFHNVNNLAISKSLKPFIPPYIFHPVLYISNLFNVPSLSVDHAHFNFNFCKLDFSSIFTFISSFDWSSTFIS